ncbi:hypothetical protein E8E11_011877 [Didymella keratinophila]|nr:hypothetical protein E8E11_011877 [Didymella keratinophila]
MSAPDTDESAPAEIIAVSDECAIETELTNTNRDLQGAGETRREDTPTLGLQQKAAMRSDGVETEETESARERRNARSDVQELTESLSLAQVATHQEASRSQRVES